MTQGKKMTSAAFFCLFSFYRWFNPIALAAQHLMPEFLESVNSLRKCHAESSACTWFLAPKLALDSCSWIDAMPFCANWSTLKGSWSTGGEAVHEERSQKPTRNQNVCGASRS